DGEKQPRGDSDDADRGRERSRAGNDRPGRLAQLASHHRTRYLLGVKRRATTSGARVRRRLQSLSARADSGSTGVTLLSMNSSLKEQHSAMADPAPQGSVRVRATEFVLFAFVALLVGFMASSA